MTKQLLTNSRSTSFKLCRRRHWYEYEIGLRPTVDAKALRMGSAFHELLDRLRQGCDLGIALADGVSRYATTDELSFEYATVETLVRWYVWRWANQNLEVVASEKTFVLPLLNPETGAASKTFSLAGKIDGIVKLEDGRLAVLENKLLGEDISSDGEMWRRLQIDQQISLYVYAARQLGFDVSAVLYDVARKPTIKPTPVPVLDGDGLKIVLDNAGQRVLTGQGKPRQTADTSLGYVVQTRPMTVEEWSDKLWTDIADRREYYFARVEVARLDSEIDECVQELWDQAKTIREAQRYSRHYRTVSRNLCVWCAYFGLCSSKRDVTSGEWPEGFEYVNDIHRELQMEKAI